MKVAMVLCVSKVVPRCRTCLAAMGVLVVFVALFCVEIAAQETPGLIEKRFQPPVRPESIIEPPELKVPERLPPPEARDIKFILVGVVIEGSTVYQDIDFLPLYEQFLKQEITLADMYKVADAITVKYRNDGYILSRAIVPPQRIRGGIVRLTIVEGFIDQVVIEGQVALHSMIDERSDCGTIPSAESMVRAWGTSRE